MFLIFIDESGYAKEWSKPDRIKEQPVHVAAAVAIHSNNMYQIYSTIREGIRNLSLPYTRADALGRGKEIKASSVDRGEGWWGKEENQSAREQVRRLYLDYGDDVTYFVACVDKGRHKAAYAIPRDPADLALQFVLERLPKLLGERNEKGVVFIDTNKREEKAQRWRLAKLLRFRSSGYRVSRFYGTIYEWQLDMKDIVEIHFGDSKYSLGLQIADFVARHTYSWWKDNKRLDYPGWSFIEPRLFKHPNYNGWGYKEFP